MIHPKCKQVYLKKLKFPKSAKALGWQIKKSEATIRNPASIVPRCVAMEMDQPPRCSSISGIWRDFRSQI